jgi:NADH:ubiquinone oxidoreductase subunit E
VAFVDGDPRNDEFSGAGAQRVRARRTSAGIPRFGHGSRVPGWDEAVDLTKAPAVIPDAAATPVPDELRTQIVRTMSKYPDRRSASIPAMHAAQALHGWLSPEAITQVAAVMQVTPAYLYSVASFYDMFKLTRRPHNDVYVCTNISCSLRGADEFFAAMAAAATDDIDVNSFECLGACDIAPMASVNGEFIGPLSPEDAPRIVEDLTAGRPVLEHKQLRYRRCADPGVAEGGRDFGPPSAETPSTDMAGMPPEGEQVDRPGGTAAIEIPREEAEE